MSKSDLIQRMRTDLDKELASNIALLRRAHDAKLRALEVLASTIEATATSQPEQQEPTLFDSSSPPMKSVAVNGARGIKTGLAAAVKEAIATFHGKTFTVRDVSRYLDSAREEFRGTPLVNVSSTLKRIEKSPHGGLRVVRRGKGGKPTLFAHKPTDLGAGGTST